MGLAEQLDSRRRAMLAEMGVRVWLPQSLAPEPEPVALAAAPAVDAPVLGRAAALTPAPAPAPAPGAQRVAAPSDAIASLVWDDMRAQVSACQACGLCQQRQQAVFGAGSQRAHWMVVGEAPGEQEDRLGEPFVGPAGQLLDRMLLAMGVTRQASDSDAPTQAQDQAQEPPAQRAYITNVIKCRPPGNRNPTPAEVAQCLPYLQRQIALLQPRVILAMGRFAAQALLAESLPDVAAQPLGKLRGQVWRYQGLPVVVTYHPAYLLRNLPDKAKAWADLCLAMDVMEGLEGNEPSA